MIFITGATGGIGIELCRLLAEENIPARALCRKQEQIQQFTEWGLETVLTDFDNIKTLRSSMQGCDTLFLLTPPTPAHTQREKQIIDSAIEAGIHHIVRISTADANLSAKLFYARSHAEIDHYLRSQQASWTILRPTGFMQNFIESAHPVSKGILPHSMKEGQVSYIDSRDIAMVAKKVLLDKSHQGGIYFLTGPQSMTAKDVAIELTVALGHNVQAVDTPEPAMRRQLVSAKLPDWHIDALIEQFAIGANGGEPDVTEEVKRITGQSPRTFAVFASDFKNEFLNHSK